MSLSPQYMPYDEMTFHCVRDFEHLRFSCMRVDIFLQNPHEQAVIQRVDIEESHLVDIIRQD